MFIPWKTMQMPYIPFYELAYVNQFSLAILWVVMWFGFAELYPEYVKGLALLNSTARADSEERKLNRDRAIRAVKQSL
jgi:hypothetical protein